MLRETLRELPGGTRFASPKLGAGFRDDLISGDTGYLAALYLIEAPLRFGPPDGIDFRLDLGLQTGEQSFCESRTRVGRKTECRVLQVFLCFSHERSVA